jgi:putative spermidine/putrescine transport system permease protein
MIGGALTWWRGLRTMICVLVGAYVLAPLAIVVLVSFSSAPFLAFPPPGFSLQWYHNLIADPGWSRSLWVSLQVMLPASVVATVLGTAAAYALVRGRIPGARLILGAMMLPIVVPGVITASALFGVYRGLGLNGTLTGLVIGHTMLALPYVVATVSAAMQGLDPRMEDAAASLGARPITAFRRVTLPLLAPAVLAGLLFAMVISFDELIVSLFVGTAQVHPVTVQMWSSLRGDFDPTTAAIATLCFGLAILALLAELVAHRRRSVDR